MGKFRVVIHGRNYRIGIATRKLVFWKSFSWKAVGFYTTRFIESETANEAIMKTMKLLRDELQHDGRATDESTMELQEIREDEDGFDKYAPGAGFTFYSEDGE